MTGEQTGAAKPAPLGTQIDSRRLAFQGTADESERAISASRRAAARRRPGLVDWYGMQWMGTSAHDSFGDRVPTWFRMLHEGKWNEAMELYWSYQSGCEAEGAFHASFNGANLIHRPGWKYLY